MTVDRSSMTFEEAEGAAAPPSQLRTKELSQELRAVLWAVIYEMIPKVDAGSVTVRWEVGEPWDSLLRRHHVMRLHRPADEYNANYQVNIDFLKSTIMQGNYVQVFGLMQWILREDETPAGLSAAVDKVLVFARAAYRVIGGDTIAPIATTEEAQTVTSAFSILQEAEFGGALKHLKTAASEATAGQWASSVRESVHAVEATARSLVPGARELGPALAALEKDQIIHPALKKGFSAIYGFSSNEQGIRHPLVDDPESKVGETEALFMLGACSSFVTYMINRGRAAGLLTQ